MFGTCTITVLSVLGFTGPCAVPAPVAPTVTVPFVFHTGVKREPFVSDHRFYGSAKGEPLDACEDATRRLIPNPACQAGG